MSDLARWTRLLERFRAGMCSPEELQELRELAAVDPARAQILGSMPPWRAASPVHGRTSATMEQDLAAVLEASRRRQGGASKDEARSDAQTFSRARPLSRLGASPRLRRKTGVWLGIAALMMVGVSIPLVWRLYDRAQHAAGVSITRSYATARGERREVVLPDSSHLVLAPTTRVSYSSSAADHGDRLLWLDGEVFLSVRHDDRRPFIVRTSSSSTRDIGTAFTVRAFPGEPVRVAVQSGRVAVQRVDPRGGQTPTLLLAAGQLGRVDTTGVTAVEHADLARYFSWQTGALTYDHASLRDILADLERAYDINVTTDDPKLEDEALVVTIRNLTVDQALRAVTEPLHARYVRHGKDVVIRRG
jgi:transmembrane sensor